MKTKLLLLLLSATLFLPSCMPPVRMASSGTESYIKNFVEKHNEGEFSTIKTIKIFSTPAINGGTIELTGLKYLSAKGLVIAATESSPVPAGTAPAQKITVSETVFITISLDQAKSIINNYKTLEDKVKAETPVAGETVYHDFTVSEDLFISYRKSYGTFPNQVTNYVDLWIKGNKFTLGSSEIVSKINAFISY